MTATIFDIERNSFVDGPGIRTTVFFKGCNLACRWCHNPESQKPQKEFMVYPAKCTGCGRCKDITVEDADFFCFDDAREICGRDYTPGEILAEVIKDKPFYENSGGGVTFSGGECMLQIDFLEEILKKCKENGIHTAVDTAGHIPWESFERIIPFTDLFLYDVKTPDAQKHKECTGADNALILENLKRLLKTNVPLWVRVPVVAGVNASIADMENIKEIFKENGYPQKTELLKYHAMGDHKYGALGREVQRYEPPSDELMAQLKKVFD